jgi:RHS repeat-associated protein
MAAFIRNMFGAIRSETGGQANDYRFTGQQLDSETAFYYLRARYYDPSTGRFLTQDPIPFPNRYAYVQNNPVLFVDPYGYLGISVHVSLPSWGDVKDWAEDAAGAAAGAAGDFLTSPWGAPVLCNPLTGPLGCAVALGVNAPVTSGVEWALSTFSNCEPSDPKEGGGTVMANCSGLAELVRKVLDSPPGYTVGDTMFIWEGGSSTLHHEQGHLPQYDWLGDYFWLAYGLGVGTGAVACKSVTDKGCIHNKNFMEWWAR